MNDGRFSGKIVAVTGAASGIGRAIIRAFVAEGANGIIVDIDQEWAHALAEELRNDGGNTLVSITNVSDAGQVDATMKQIIDPHGRLDIMVNNAGVGVHKEVVDLSEEEWDFQLNVQLKGTFLCSRAAAWHMVAHKTGNRIINIGSTAAENARIAAAPHCVSKAGIVMLTKVMALELGQHGITVFQPSATVSRDADRQVETTHTGHFLPNGLGNLKTFHVEIDQDDLRAFEITALFNKRCDCARRTGAAAADISDFDTSHHPVSFPHP